MEVKLISKNIEETISLAKFISKYLFRGSVITLNGDLGAGKTTFTKGIGEGLNLNDDINSPTFNILKCYFNGTLPLYHIDAYRLEDVPEENKNIGLEEVIEGDGVSIIEWPIFIKEFINENEILDINITINESNERLFVLETLNKKYTNLFEEIHHENFNIR